MKQVSYLNPFGRFCCTFGNLPTSYMESLTYEQQLMWFCKFLDEKVIPANNANAEAIKELQDYLQNLDLQDEVNNKLDQMAESGQLQQMVDNIFLELTDRMDDMNFLNVKTLGAKGDGVTDDTAIIQEAMETGKPLYFPDGTYIISQMLVIDGPVHWEGQSNKTILNSRPLSDLHPNYVSPLVDFSSSNNIVLKNFCSTNSTFRIYKNPYGDLTSKERMKDKYIFVENVTNDIADGYMAGMTNWQGFFLNIPAPDNYERDFHTGKYPRYGIQIYNNSGYNAIDINNIILDGEGEYANVLDNSAIGIVDGVRSSAPAFFIDMHAERNAINIKNRTSTSTANSSSNPDSVFQIGYQGHVAIGCSVYDETGAQGVASLKIKDSEPSIKFYDTVNNDINGFRVKNDQFQTIACGLTRSYYKRSGEKVYVAPLKIETMANTNGGLILASDYASGKDFHFFVNDKGLPKMHMTDIDAGQTNENGYTIQYNMNGPLTSKPSDRLTNNYQTIGFMYFDTTNNKPIWWTGTGWVDATGSAVS